ncbi:MAG: hypothetical protein U0414_36080 [Polyangiaceae bacterium]
MQSGDGPEGPFGHPPGGYGPAPEYARPAPPEPRPQTAQFGQHLPAIPHPDERGEDGCLLACPRCQSSSVSKPSFTWWGGVVGPSLLKHRVCAACGFGFNGNSGKSNNTAIALYVSFFFVVAIVVGALLLRR